MALKFKEPPKRKHVNVLLYGPPKTGKTWGAGSAPGTILYVNADQENATIQVHERAAGRVHEPEFEGFQTITDIETLLKQDNPGVDTIVVDPISEVYRVMLEQQSQNAIRPTLNQRGDVVVHLERFCRALCEAPVNAVFVAHELTLESEGQPNRYVPYTGTSKPTLGLKIAGMVDVVGYTARMEVPVEGSDQPAVHYVAQLVEGRGRLGGDRFNVLGPWRPIDLAEWFGLILGGSAAESTTNQTQEVAA